jgi:aminopeptidase N
LPAQAAVRPGDRLAGTTTVTATATATLSRFSGFSGGVSAVRVDGAPAGAAGRHRQRGRPRAARQARFTVEVDYAGVPARSAAPTWAAAASIPRTARSPSASESASTWFPVSDHPADKATYDIEVTVPDGLAALSNGVPGERSSTGGWTTWRWAERAPMASYLTTLVIGDYRVATGTHAGKPMVTAVASSLPAEGPAAASLARTGEVADFLASRFGPYPFDSYGGIAVAEQRIGHAGSPVPPGVRAGLHRWPANLSVVARLAQWFGNRSGGW